jgi:hypothetical protein
MFEAKIMSPSCFYFEKHKPHIESRLSVFRPMFPLNIAFWKNKEQASVEGHHQADFQIRNFLEAGNMNAAWVICETQTKNKHVLYR